MFNDIMFALLIALFIELFSTISKRFKHLMIIVSSIIVICVYFTDPPQFQQVIEIDFGIWVLFVILFDELLSFLINKYLIPLSDKLDKILYDKNEGEPSS